MIPTIEDIVDMVRHAQCDRKQAIAWLERHVEMARERCDQEELRDHFAALAMQGRLAAGMNDDADSSGFEAVIAYQIADAMLKARG